MNDKLTLMYPWVTVITHEKLVLLSSFVVMKFKIMVKIQSFHLEPAYFLHKKHGKA
jgi:hypothetical protein